LIPFSLTFGKLAVQPGMHTYSSTLEANAGGSQVQGQPWLYSKTGPFGGVIFSSFPIAVLILEANNHIILPQKELWQEYPHFR
jgi:hypothetical protein